MNRQTGAARISIAPTKAKGASVWRSLLECVSLAAGFVLLRLTADGLYGQLAFGLFVGALYCNRLLAPSVLFLATSFASGIDCVLVSAVQCAVMLGVSFVHIKCRRKINKWLLILYLAASQIFFVLFKTSESQELVNKLIAAGAGIVFSFVCIYVLRALFIRGLKYRLTVEENICLAVFALCVFKALDLIRVGGVGLLAFIAPLAVLLTLFVYGKSACYALAATIGFACALNAGSLTQVAVCGLWSVCAVAFMPLSRWLSALALLLCEVALVYFFDIYDGFNSLRLIAAVASCAVFCCIPGKTLEYLKAVSGNTKEKYSPRHIVNRLRVNLSRKLFELSEIFYAMQLTFKTLNNNVIPLEKAQVSIANEVAELTCKDCPESVKCWRREIKDSEQAFCDVVGNALDRGKATVLDLNSSLASRCLRTSTLLSNVNQQVAAYKQYYLVAASSDNSRNLIGDQLGGVSRIMLGLSEESKATIRFDTEREKQLVEQLTFYNILTKEAVIFNEGGELNVTLVVNSRDARKENLESVVSEVVNAKLGVCARENTDNENWTVLYLKPKPVYDVEFGFCAAKKAGSEVSGDTHSFVRLDKDKFLLAVCDGMGSGKEAERASESAVSLVENFYKAGFDNELILKSVNRLLTSVNDETFTAVDICVVDLMKGTADFIKLGAPQGLIKSGGEVQFVSGGSLPLGVLEEMQPTITKKALKANDVIVLASDGFSDAFENKDDMAALLAETESSDPQIIADKLFGKAMINYDEKPKDDITVIVARIKQ